MAAVYSAAYMQYEPWLPMFLGTLGVFVLFMLVLLMSVHLIRGVYYGSFAQPREAVWLTGWSARGLPCGRWRWWVHLSGEVAIHGLRAVLHRRVRQHCGHGRVDELPPLGVCDLAQHPVQAAAGCLHGGADRCHLGGTARWPAWALAAEARSTSDQSFSLVALLFLLFFSGC